MNGGANASQITMEDLQLVEHVCRTDPAVIEQCVISGIPKEDMHKVYCDRKFTFTVAFDKHTNLAQPGLLATTSGLATKSDFNKLLCITGHTLTTVNTPSLSISAPSSTQMNEKSSTLIFQKSAEQ